MPPPGILCFLLSQGWSGFFVFRMYSLAMASISSWESTTKSINPSLKAFLGLASIPWRIYIREFCNPRMYGLLEVPPAPGNIPALISGKPILIFVELKEIL